jgi:hypothetical protein
MRRLPLLMLLSLMLGEPAFGNSPAADSPAASLPAAASTVTDTPVEDAAAAQQQPVDAQTLPPSPDAEHMQALASDVLASADFGGVRKEIRWGWDWRLDDWWQQKKPEPEQPELSLGWLNELSAFLGSLGQVLLWGLLLLLLVLIWRKRAALQALLPARRQHSEFVGGIDIAPLLQADAPVDDVTAAAQHLWGLGHARDALGLIYRAALQRLGKRFSFEVPLSGTEQECLRLVAGHADANTTRAFRHIVSTWTRCAWAHELPSSLEEMLTSYRITAQHPEVPR